MMSIVTDPPQQFRSPYQIPIFRAVWSATLISGFGALIQGVGASWLMTSLSGDPKMIALVQTTTTLPIMFFALCAGAMADNLDRRKVMLGAQCFMLIVSVALAFCAWGGLLTPTSLLVFTFLIGCGLAINGPASQAIIGDMVPRSLLSSAVALNSMSFNIARSVGPAIGGAIVAIAGAATAFLVNACSYLALIFVLARWHPVVPTQVLPRERLGLAMAAGVRYAAMSPNMRRVFLRAALFGLAISAISSMMPIVARDLIGGGALTFGLLLGAFGAGAVGAGMAIGPIRRKLSPEQMVQLSAVGAAIGSAVEGTSPFLILTMIALLFAGMGWILALSTFNVSVQLSAPRWVVGRALSLYQMSAFGGMAIGAFLFGLGASRYGVTAALLVAALMHVAGMLLGRWMPMANYESANLDPYEWAEPATSVPVEHRSGPIAISISYTIEQGDLAQFLTLMSERRRVRRRDGARRWSLLRDLGEPLTWIEQYEVPTWLEYVRHNQRHTIADTENWHAILNLHHSDAAPKVQRLIERQTGGIPFGRDPDPREMEPVTSPSS
jgi:MFS family permease